MVYEANVNKTLHYIKYCLLDNISKVYQTVFTAVFTDPKIA